MPLQGLVVWNGLDQIPESASSVWPDVRAPLPCNVRDKLLFVFDKLGHSWSLTGPDIWRLKLSHYLFVCLDSVSVISVLLAACQHILTAACSDGSEPTDWWYLDKDVQGSECCVFILEFVLSNCDWKKYEAMPWHIKGRSQESKQFCQVLVSIYGHWQRLHLYFSHILPAQSKDSRTIALLSTNFTLSLFYTLPVKRLLHMHHLVCWFPNLAAVYKLFCPFYCAGILGMVIRRGLGVLFFG